MTLEGWLVIDDLVPAACERGKAKEAPVDVDAAPSSSCSMTSKLSPGSRANRSTRDIASFAKSRTKSASFRVCASSPDEVVEMLGVGRDYLDVHIKPELRNGPPGRKGAPHFARRSARLDSPRPRSRPAGRLTRSADQVSLGHRLICQRSGHSASAGAGKNAPNSGRPPLRAAVCRGYPTSVQVARNLTECPSSPALRSDVVHELWR